MTESDSTTVSAFLEFLGASPTPFHAVDNLADLLGRRGFQRLDESEPWQLRPGGRYFMARNGSSLIGFVYGSATLSDSGLRLIGAHTDSPCLKIKPQPDLRSNGYHRLGVEVYGGALLNTWFDRDLSIAGRISFSNGQGISHALVDFSDPVAVIPSLAIHLDREQNTNKTVNAQTQLPAILSLNESCPT